MDSSEFAELLDASDATDGFKEDVQAYIGHRPAPRVEVGRHIPRVKVLRLLTQLLHAEPGLALDSVHIEGTSGCSDFRGVLRAHAADGTSRVFEFVWDCQWRAIQEGWTDGFGLPDQIRAARAFEWRCFAHWRERVAPGADARRSHARAPAT